MCASLYPDEDYNWCMDQCLGKAEAGEAAFHNLPSCIVYCNTHFHAWPAAQARCLRRCVLKYVGYPPVEPEPPAPTPIRPRVQRMSVCRSFMRGERDSMLCFCTCYGGPLPPSRGYIYTVPVISDEGLVLNASTECERHWKRYTLQAGRTSEFDRLVEISEACSTFCSGKSCGRSSW
jgi:hypothetical protein